MSSLIGNVPEFRPHGENEEWVQFERLEFYFQANKTVIKPEDDDQKKSYTSKWSGGKNI